MTWSLCREYNSDINYKEIKFILQDCYNYKPCATGQTRQFGFQTKMSFLVWIINLYSVFD